MKIKNYVIPVLILGLISSLTLSPNLYAQEKEQQAKVIIPEKVRTVLQEGRQTREARLDIPFTINEHLYLPAQQNLHNIFIFTIKNADLGYTAIAPAEGAVEKEGEETSTFQAASDKLQAKAYMFLQFENLDIDFSKEVYVPINFQVDSASYDPEKEETYTTGYPLPSGKYLLSMAITSEDMQKIGTQYFEFTTPDPASFTEEMGTTPVFFAKNIKRIAAAETITEVHKDFFTYSVLQVLPNSEKVFKAGDNLDIFFFIFGTQLNESNQADLLINYEVLQEEDTQIKYADQKYNSPFISQPLPIKKTVVVTTTTEEGKKEEKKETKDLEPGSYTLKITIKDNLSGKTLEINIDFEMK